MTVQELIDQLTELVTKGTYNETAEVKAWVGDDDHLQMLIGIDRTSGDINNLYLEIY